MSESVDSTGSSGVLILGDRLEAVPHLQNLVAVVKVLAQGDHGLSCVAPSKHADPSRKVCSSREGPVLVDFGLATRRGFSCPPGPEAG